MDFRKTKQPFAPIQPNATIRVSGQSLGGIMTPVIALYLQDTAGTSRGLPRDTAITANVFAAATPGNSMLLLWVWFAWPSAPTQTDLSALIFNHQPVAISSSARFWFWFRSIGFLLWLSLSHQLA
jgi:hypothetical protein